MGDNTLEITDTDETTHPFSLLRRMLEIPSLSGQERPLAEFLCAEMARRAWRPMLTLQATPWARWAIPRDP